MFKPILKIGNRTLIVALEVSAVAALLSSIAFGGFVWRLSQGPVSIGWAKDYVEDGLSNAEENLDVKFDNLVFSWPELKGPFYLDLTGLRVTKGKDESNSLSVDEASVGLSRTSLFFGRIRPVSVIIRKPSLELVRASDGGLSLLLEHKPLNDDAKDQAPQQNPPAQSPHEQIAQFFKDMANRKEGATLSRLRKFEIRDASVAIRDYEYGLSWYLTDLDFAVERKAQGVAASFDIILPGGRKENAGVTIDMVYRKETDDFRAAVNMREINPYVISRFLPVPDMLSGQDLYFSGTAEAAMDTNLVPAYVKFSGSIPQGQVVVPEEYDAPIDLKNIVLETEYNAAEGAMSIANLSGEINGIGFKGTGNATGDKDTFALPLQIAFSDFDLAQIPPLFPKSEHNGEAYQWLGHDLQGGRFSNVALDMRLTGKKTVDAQTQHAAWDVDLPDFKIGFAFDGTNVHYSPTLMPAQNAKGTGTLDLGAQVLEIKGESANIGDMQGRDITVKVTDLMTPKAGFVYVTLKAKGPMSTALTYIASEPINMGKEEIGIDPTTVKGTIDAALDISLPTIKDVPKEQVNVDIKGVMTDINIPSIVEGLPLSGGPLQLATEPGGFRIKGNAQLAGRDTTMEWHQYFESAGHPYSMQVKAQVGADKELRNHFGVNLDEYISGTLPVDVLYTHMGDGTASVDVKGDLNPVRIYIDPFKFEKPAGVAGSLSLKAALKNDVLKNITDISLNSRNISVSGATLGFAEQNGRKADLAKGDLPNAVIGKTKAKVNFDVGKDNVMKVTANASVFDLAPFLQETEASNLNVEAQQAKKEKQQAMKVTLSAPTMLAKNEQSAKNTKTYIEMDDEGDITRLEYDAKVGKEDLSIRFKPDASGKRTFRLHTNDAGNTLYTFGLYDNIHGGSLLIYGEPAGGDLRGDLHGTMRMENFRVIKAPALASLLSLMSLQGVSQLLGNEGLVFSKLESGFEWRFRPSGNLLIIKDGTTSGSSVGLTFSGVVDRGKKTTDVAGTIIPMTEINSLLSKIPLVGELLGGRTGLFAATYSMKGPTSDPKVSVNPISILAPGIVRRILFEGGYESKIPDDDAVAPAKKPAAKAQDKTSKDSAISKTLVNKTSASAPSNKNSNKDVLTAPISPVMPATKAKSRTLN